MVVDEGFCATRRARRSRAIKRVPGKFTGRISEAMSPAKPRTIRRGRRAPQSILLKFSIVRNDIPSWPAAGYTGSR